MYSECSGRKLILKHVFLYFSDLWIGYTRTRHFINRKKKKTKRKQKTTRKCGSQNAMCASYWKRTCLFIWPKTNKKFIIFYDTTMNFIYILNTNVKQFHSRFITSARLCWFLCLFFYYTGNSTHYITNNTKAYKSLSDIWKKKNFFL